jgi:hypothetical protein
VPGNGRIATDCPVDALGSIPAGHPSVLLAGVVPFPDDGSTSSDVSYISNDSGRLCQAKSPGDEYGVVAIVNFQRVATSAVDAPPPTGSSGKVAVRTVFTATRRRTSR